MFYQKAEPAARHRPNSCHPATHTSQLFMLCSSDDCAARQTNRSQKIYTAPAAFQNVGVSVCLYVYFYRRRGVHRAENCTHPETPVLLQQQIQRRTVLCCEGGMEHRAAPCLAHHQDIAFGCSCPHGLPPKENSLMLFTLSSLAALLG